MPVGVDQRCFLLGEPPPKQEDEALVAGRKCADDGIGKTLPAMSLVRARLIGAHRKGGVEQEYALLRPTREVAVARPDDAHVALQFSEYVLERGRWWYAGRYRKAKTMCLPRPMVRVLAQDHHTYGIERRGVEGREDLPCRWVHDVLLPLRDQEVAQFGEVVGLEFGSQGFIPARPNIWSTVYVVILCHGSRRSLIEVLKHFREPFVTGANFATSGSYKPVKDHHRTNERMMKKVFQAIVAVVLTGAMLTACGSHQSCPAYGKVHKVPAEKQV